MKFVIVSDSHGNTWNFSEVLRRRRGRDDALLFLGDGYRDAEAMAAEYGLGLFSVAGNCDSLFSISMLGTRPQQELLLTFEGVKILMMHGHTHGVNGGVGSAADYARSRGADVLLFGHTHVKLERYLPGEEGGRPLWIFNPGSISRPRDGSASFGTLEVKDGSVIFGHGTV